MNWEQGRKSIEVVVFSTQYFLSAQKSQYNTENDSSKYRITVLFIEADNLHIILNKRELLG